MCVLAEFLIAWDDGDPPSWVDGAQTTLVDRVPPLSEMPKGTHVLSLWHGTVTIEDDDSVDEVWFSAQVTSRVLLTVPIPMEDNDLNSYIT